MDLTKKQIDQVVKELKPIDTELEFEEMVEDCYDSVTVGWINVHPAQVIKKFDSIAWEQAKLEYLDSRQKDGELVSFDNEETFYSTWEIKDLLELE